VSSERVSCCCAVGSWRVVVGVCFEGHCGRAEQRSLPAHSPTAMRGSSWFVQCLAFLSLGSSWRCSPHDRRVQLSTLNAGPDREDQVQGQYKKKKKRNKYSQFSKGDEGGEAASLDLGAAIRKADLEAERQKTDRAEPSRGTTVPTLAASPKLKRVRKPATAVPEQQQQQEQVDIYKSIIPSDPYTFGYVQIGRCMGPHGVHGELKLQLETDFADTRLSPGSILHLKRPNRLTPRPVRVELGRRQAGNTYLVKLEGVKTRITALAFKDFVVFAKREDRPALDESEYLVRDLVGLDVHVQGGVLVGCVEGVVLPEDLCESSAAAKLMHGMIEVRKRFTGELCLLPLVPQIVTHVDLVKRVVVVDPPAGLLDLVYVEKQKTVALRGFLPAESVVLTAKAKKLLYKQSAMLFPESP